MYNKQQDLDLELLFDFVKPEKFSTKRLNFTLYGLVDFFDILPPLKRVGFLDASV